MLIYKITNQLNGKVYVGKTGHTLEQRFQKHLGHVSRKVNRHLYDAMNHYGSQHFIIELIEQVDDMIANERERHWITTLGTRSPVGYNMTDGGDGGNTLAGWSEDERLALWKRQGESRRGHTISRATRQKISEAHQGGTCPEETRQQIRETLKTRGISPPAWTKWQKGQPGAFAGKTHTQEARGLISEARLGKTYEDIFGERAEEERDKRKQRWLGASNPRFVHVNNWSRILSLLADQTMSLVAATTGVSEFKIRQFLRLHDIQNVQLARQSPDWRERLEEIAKCYSK